MVWDVSHCYGNNNQIITSIIYPLMWRLSHKELMCVVSKLNHYPYWLYLTHKVFLQCTGTYILK